MADFIRPRISQDEYVAIQKLRDGTKLVEPGGIDGIIGETRSKQQLNSLYSNQKQFVDKIQELEIELQNAYAIREYEPSVFNVPAPKSKSRNEATAIVQWSDWHVDEVVNPKTVNGMNAYNPEVARKRALKLFANTVKLTDTQRHDIDIPTLVVHLGGDFIGGYIHEELQQTNSMSPLEGIFFSLDLLTTGINYLVEHGRFKRILFVCNVGNHGRLTRKMQYANGYSMNYETYLYHALANNFKDNKNLLFSIPESEIIYLDVYGKPLRFFHGHQVKFAGGIGGVTVPLYKYIHRQNSNKSAFYNFMCDKHTYSNPMPDCQLNGSLKGYDAFAAGHGFLFQEPLQSFSLIDAQRGVTIKSKIFCE